MIVSQQSLMEAFNPTSFDFDLIKDNPVPVPRALCRLHREHPEPKQHGRRRLSRGADPDIRLTTHFANTKTI